MRPLLAFLLALGGCGQYIPSPPGVVCRVIWLADEAPDFAPGIVDFQRGEAEFGAWVLLATGGVFGFSVTEDSTVFSDPRCIR